MMSDNRPLKKSPRLPVNSWLSLFFFVGLLGTSFSVSGCSVLSFADLATSGRESKQKSLNERVTKFHRELYWNKGAGYLEFIEDSKRQELARQFRQIHEIEKFVDLDIRELKLHDDDSDLADVEVKVRSYKKASLMVSERFEKETWAYYRTRGGWFLTGREISSTSSPE